MVKSAPLYTAFTVRKAQGEGKDVWIAIGAAWPHRDEKGIDVVLDALPVDGKVVFAFTNRATASRDMKRTATARGTRILREKSAAPRQQVSGAKSTLEEITLYQAAR